MTRMLVVAAISALVAAATGYAAAGAVAGVAYWLAGEASKRWAPPTVRPWTAAVFATWFDPPTYVVWLDDGTELDVADFIEGHWTND